jgi:hypothetical protein
MKEEFLPAAGTSGGSWNLVNSAVDYVRYTHFGRRQRLSDLIQVARVLDNSAFPHSDCGLNRLPLALVR